MNKYNIALCTPKKYINKLEKLLAPLYMKPDLVVHVEGKKWIAYWDYTNYEVHEKILLYVQNLDIPYYDFLSLSDEGKSWEEHSKEDAPYILGTPICYYHKGKWIGL